MVAFTLPKNSKITKGKHYPAPEGAKEVKTFKIYRYDPEGSENPRWDTYDVDVSQCGPMVLDVLLHIKNTVDPTLALRRSCREGVCGSCAMNIGGRNTLACTHGHEDYGDKVSVSPLPSLPVVKDLVADLTLFYAQLRLHRALAAQRQPDAAEGVDPEPRGPKQARWSLRVHPVRLLHHLLPKLLVERREISRPGGLAAGEPLAGG